MPGGTTEVHRDSDYLATGTHGGADSASVLQDIGADFKSCGVMVGLAIYNTTQSTNGLVTAVTEDTVTDDTNSWDAGDTYEIFKTSSKNSLISTQWTDLSRGWKSDRKKLEAGWKPKDIDKKDKEWSQGFPEKSRG